VLKQREAPATRKPTGTVKRGTGANEYKVKGHRASAKQRQVIEGCLGQAKEDNASRRVMIGVVMCITQESGAGELANVMTGNDDVGIYQQGRNWISESGSKDPGASTHAYLITGPTSWKKVHGSVKKAPGNLSLAIHAVQGNRDPNAYAAWEDEATRTVDTWLDNGGSEGGGGGAYAQSYTFSRGEKGGQREDSWDASARLVGDVGAYRWAAGNVFYAASGDELRAGGPSLMIYGDEGWLQRQPAWSWASGRSISEITLQALAGRWDVMPGGVVSLHRRYGAMQGKWMVWNVSGTSLTSPEVTIVLRRPTRLKREPPHEMAGGGKEGSGSGGGTGSIYSACKAISDEKHLYPKPMVHHGPWKNLKPNTPLDCSESVSLALHMAGLFGDRKQAIVSGEFVNWGKPGKGDEWTVWYHGGHVWLEHYGDDGKFDWRFDTSHHPESGPRLVRTARNDQARFKARHAG
jgi:hypothetical protein